MEAFELTLETLEELRTQEWFKKLKIQRKQEIEKCASEIERLFANGEASDSQVAFLIGECFNACNFSEQECRQTKYNALKQSIMARAHSHNKVNGKHRTYYRYKDRQINIYTCRDLEALNYLEHFMKSNRDSWSESYNDVRTQKYRVEHGIDNFVQVDLFDAIAE
jgi:hypothetical protein